MSEEKKQKTKIVKSVKKEASKPERYFEARGGRKRASARVRITKDAKPGKKKFVVNSKDVNEYFSTEATRLIAHEALNKVKAANRFNVSAKISGGGIHAQSEALRHGIARALILFNEEWRRKLKKNSYLKRDPRKKERKKFGLKKARKAPQWSKR